MQTTARRARLAAVLCTAMLAALGCDSDSETRATERESASSARARYAVMYEVYDDVGSTSYLSVVDSLEGDTLDRSKAHELAGGRAYLRAFGDWLFVGEPSAPVVKRYAVREDGSLEEQGSIGFGSYGLGSGEIDHWGLTFVSATKAYLFHAKEGTTIVWNPTAMEITGEIPAPPEFLRPGYETQSSPGVLRGNRLYRSVYWANWDTFEHSPDHLLAVYDVEKDELLSLTGETRCPGPGNLAHTDEQGNIYFSNWIWPVAGTLLRGAPPSCVLRIEPGSDGFDPDWTLSYAALSGGREGAMFTYLSNGKGLVSIFDAATPFDRSIEPNALVSRPEWSVWSVDLATRTGAPLEGIPTNSGAYTPVELDGRSFLLVPFDGWKRTQVFEIVDGRGVPRVSIPGWSYAVVKVP